MLADSEHVDLEDLLVLFPYDGNDNNDTVEAYLGRSTN